MSEAVYADAVTRLSGWTATSEEADLAGNGPSNCSPPARWR
jgi:hypothetical protein